MKIHLLFRRFGTFVLSFGKIQHKIGYPAMVRRRDRETLVLNMGYIKRDSIPFSVGGMVLGNLAGCLGRLLDPQVRARVERNVERSEGRRMQTALDPEFAGSLALLCVYELLHL